MRDSLSYPDNLLFSSKSEHVRFLLHSKPTKKTHMFTLKVFNEKIILDPEFYI